MSKQQLNIKKILRAIVWATVAMLVLVMFIAARYNSDNKKCKGVEVVINDAADNFFISKEEVQLWVEDWAGADVTSVQLNKLDILSLEKSIQNKKWVNDIDVFVDDDAMLHVNITERQPVARVFNRLGQSFYMDSSKEVLPMHLQMAARVPVFTGFAGQINKLNKNDSSVMAQAVFLSNALMKDSFLMAMVEQIDINAVNQFELVPKIGNHIVYLGDTSALQAKFSKLKSFYKNVLALKGWNTYSAIYLDYKDQVVAKIKDSADVLQDAAKTLMLMELMVSKAKAITADSIVLPKAKAINNMPIDSTVLMQSVEREEEGDEAIQRDPVANLQKENKSSNLLATENKVKIILEKKKITAEKQTVTSKTNTKLEAKKQVVTKKPPDKNAKAVMPKLKQKTN